MTLSFHLVGGRPPVQSVQGLHPGRKMFVKGDTLFAYTMEGDPFGIYKLGISDSSLTARQLNGAPPVDVRRMSYGVYRLDVTDYDVDAGFWAEFHLNNM